MPSHPHRLLPLLALLTVLAIISTSIYLPSVPAMARAFGADVAAVQFTLTVFLIPYALAQLVHGPLSDRFGRRPVLFGGLLVTLLASIACALAPSIHFLIAARIVQGIGASAGVVVARAVVRDLFTRAEAARANSIIGMSLAVSPAMGPVLGGQLQVLYNWHASFLFLTVVAGATLALAWWQLPETNIYRSTRSHASRGLLAGYRLLLLSPPFWGFAFVIAGAFGGSFAFQIGAPVTMINLLGISPSTYGWLAAAPPCGSFVGSILSNMLTLRLGIERLILIASVIYAAAGLLMASLAVSGVLDIAALTGPMILFSAGLGLMLPNALAGVVSLFPAYAGTAAALTGCLQMLFAALATFAVGSLPKTSAMPLTLVIAVSGFIGLFGWLLLGRRQAPELLETPLIPDERP
jgi:DHA1 family bicyclomycin/chloramphenicol resistance-like MFS transporter